MWLVLLAGINQGAAQGVRFFRVSGPAATIITAFRPDGTLVWNNAQPGATYTVQTVTSLPGGTNWVDYVQLPVTAGVNTNQVVSFNAPSGMALIPAGSFTIGNSIGDTDITDAPPVTVNVSAFYMDTNLVSYSQWGSVYSWAIVNGYGLNSAGSKAANQPNQPVQSVNWYDTVKWCNARSQQARLTPVYYTDAGLTQVYTNGYVDAVFPNWMAKGYRLPTEAEWEKAARGGLSGQRFPWGDTISESQANYYGSSFYFSYDLGPDGYNAIGSIGGTFPATSPVGSFAPNGYGLYDMAGDVFEWCWDWYATPYAGGSDPRGPASSPADSRVSRGGCWANAASFATCAYREQATPLTKESLWGFRCVKGV